MIAALVTTLLAFVTGIPLAMALPVSAHRFDLRMFGEAYLLGVALQWGVLLSLSLAGVPWSVPIAVIAVVVVSAAAAVFVIRRRQRWVVEFPPLTLIDLGTLILLGGYGRFATIASPIEADYVGIWGVKAARFAIVGGIDWGFLSAPFNAFAHVDYPLLVPFAYDFQSLVAGEWIGRWAGVLNIGFAVATLFILRTFLAREMSAVGASLATLALVPLAASPYIGIAEGAMVAFGTAALLEARGDDATRAAVLLGLASSCKNEGITLTIAVVLALMLSGRWSAVRRLWPALVIPLPWFVASRLHGLHGDLTEGSILTRVIHRFADPGELIRTLAAQPTGRPLFVGGVALALFVGASRLARRERFIAIAIALQLLAFIAAYVVTPHDISWHVRWSWERLVMQLDAVLVFLAFVVIAPDLPWREKSEQS